MSQDPALRALIDRIIPPDDLPGGWDAGAGDFLRNQLDAETLSNGLARLDAAATEQYGAEFAELDPTRQDSLITDALRTNPSEFLDRVIALAIQGFYGDPANGGNRDSVSWRMIGYRDRQPDTVLPAPRPGPATITADRIADRYDAVVVGAGAGGGVVACVLAEAGWRVLVVERGSWLPVEQPSDHLRNQRSLFGYETPAGPPLNGNPRVLDRSDGPPITIGPGDGRWNNNAMTLGGGTRVYGAQAWRFAPEDFRMASIYGVPEGSSLADWPITYADLEPYYDRAEWEFGVSGSVGGNAAEGPRRRGYPMPPVRQSAATAMLAGGAKELGWTTGPVPLLINSQTHDGRAGCAGCGTCVGFVCPVDAKNGSHNTVIPRALATGNCDLLLESQVTRVSTDSDGNVIGVRLAGGREVTARHVVLTAGAIETARLLLASRSSREPDGLGNTHDQVGRNLQGHVYSGAIGTFEQVVQECLGPGPTISTNDFRHHNGDLVGGGMLANDFVPTPLNTYGLLNGLGLLSRWGAESKRGMRELYSRSAVIMGPIQEVSNPQSRVRIADDVTDAAGMPVARLSGGILAEDRRAARFLADRAVEWLTASSARTVTMLRQPSDRANDGPSGGQHQAGTCRMGTEAGHSVTDPYGRVWGHDNLHLADASLHVTNGGVNPVLTVLANAYRVGDAIVRDG